jgi:hypothetical protein
MKELIFSKDKYKMNWLREECEYAKIRCPQRLEYKVSSEKQGDVIRTKITFTNMDRKPFFTSTGDIGIYFPLQDKYESSEICMTQRCHAHIFCGKNISYIMALRMGGEAPHLGMVVTKGSIENYSIERDYSKMSNDRGLFILNPSPVELAAGESFSIEWTIFPHEGKEDFYNTLKTFDNYIEVSSERYILFEGESTNITIKPAFAAKEISINSKVTEINDNSTVIHFNGDSCGEKIFHIDVDGIKTSLKLLVVPKLDTFAKSRCHFIAKHQQYSGKLRNLEGSYLTYDNEENHIFYANKNDYNGGRERVGMAILIAKYLQKHKDEKLSESLESYISFMLRELVDVNSGEVFNDINRDNSYIRLYNYPWFAEFCIELYKLYGIKDYLTYAVNIIRKLYHDGGASHYSIEVPVLLLSEALEAAGMSNEKSEVDRLFITHADKILSTGTAYPAHEVNYEQSIVAPATNILFQVYLLTKEERYLEAGRKQLQVLELFNGLQPDYHLYETAIRHWDGYWFGKYKLYGDTFPHYWSALTGNSYLLYAICTGDKEYYNKAEASFRGVLSMFKSDGTATCAYVYPHTVNGIRANLADPYANDQDWAMYFMLRFVETYF